MADDLVTRLRRARRVTVLTGAGVSVSSGVPTFRGAGGLWESFRAEGLATPEAFARDPLLVWRWYDWRRQQLAGLRPNAAHAVLARWQDRLPGFTLLTQNVDGLHELAGSHAAVRLHGSIWQVRCAGPCRDGASREERCTPLPELPPRCGCGRLLRPDIVWFGEGLDPGVVRRAEAALVCDVFIAAGTSALVYPAAGFVDAARDHGAFTVEINPDATPASGRVDLSLRGPAEVVLVEIDARLGAAHEPAGRP